nr:hypothetical protein [Tanacetum cinerariifolium]
STIYGHPYLGRASTLRLWLQPWLDRDRSHLGMEKYWICNHGVKGIFLRLLRRVYIMGLCIVFNRCGMLHSVSALMNDRANGKTKSEVDE